MAETVNEQVLGDITAHSLNLYRLEGTEARRIKLLLIQLRDELVAELARLDPTGVKAQTYRQRRLEALLAQTQATIRTSYRNARSMMTDDLVALAKAESAFGFGIIANALHADTTTVVLTPNQLRAMASDTLIRGNTVGTWLSQQAQSLQTRLQTEMSLGIAQGETLSQLVQRIRGSATGRQYVMQENGKKKVLYDFAGGLFDLPTRQAESLARTAVQTIANTARWEGFKANSDVIKGVQAVATLDTRTTPLCIARSGSQWTLDGAPMGDTKEPFPGPPPWHWNCRTTLVPITKSWAELGVTSKGRVPPEFRPTTQASMDGQVPAHLTYFDWLKKKEREAPGFAQDILGKKQYELWKAGALTRTELLAAATGEMTAAELAQKVGTDVIFTNAKAWAVEVAARKTAPAARQAVFERAMAQAADLGIEQQVSEQLAELKALIEEEVAAAAKIRTAALSRFKAAIVANTLPTTADIAVWKKLGRDEQNRLLAKWQRSAKSPAEHRRLMELLQQGVQAWMKKRKTSR